MQLKTDHAQNTLHRASGSWTPKICSTYNCTANKARGMKRSSKDPCTGMYRWVRASSSGNGFTVVKSDRRGRGSVFLVDFLPCRTWIVKKCVNRKHVSLELPLVASGSGASTIYNDHANSHAHPSLSHESGINSTNWSGRMALCLISWEPRCSSCECQRLCMH